MTASLNQSSSPTSCSVLVSNKASTTQPLRETTKQQGGIPRRIDAQADAAPFEREALAADKIFNSLDARARTAPADLDVAEVEPELVRCRHIEGDRSGDGVRPVDRFLDETDHLGVIDRRKPQVGSLQQGRVCPPHGVEASDIVLDVARLVPVAHLELVLLRIEIFLLAGDGLVLDQLEAVVDSIISGER